MRQAIVYLNRQRVGELTEELIGHYVFRYDDLWWADNNKPALSLTLPKKQQTYEADQLFPFFANMLSEGANRKLQCRHLQID